MVLLPMHYISRKKNTKGNIEATMKVVGMLISIFHTKLPEAYKFSNTES